MGTAINVPRNCRKLRWRNNRRMISTPLSSSPCTAADTNSIGPERRPRTTCTGMVRLAWVYRSATGNSSDCRQPAAISTPPIVNGGCTAPRLGAMIAAPSAAAAGTGLALPRIGFDKADDTTGNILAGRRFDALESGRGVDLHDHRAVIGAQNIDA